jgi:hypothetical protein
MQATRYKRNLTEFEMENSMNTEETRTSSNAAKRCAIYARAASTEQTGNSTVANQIDHCRKAAQEQGWNVVEECIRTDIGRSGMSMQERTGLQELMALAVTTPRPFDVLACNSVSVLSRSQHVMEKIAKSLASAGVSILFVQDGFEINIDETAACMLAANLSTDPTFQPVRGLHKPLVTQETFDRVQTILAVG